MNSRSLLAIAAVVVALVLVSAAALAGLFVAAPMVLADRYSHYDYEFHVETTGDLADVALSLPVPAGPDGPALGDVVVRDDDGNLTDRKVVSPDELPEDMTNRKATPIETRYTVHVFYEFRDGGEPIETKTPVGSEPTLAPKLDLDEVACDPPYTDADDTCYEFRTMAYAEYDAGADTVVTLSGEYSGWNEWGWGLSNSYNAFTERVERTTLQGPQDGWVVLPADLNAGEGSYPTRGN